MIRVRSGQTHMGTDATATLHSAELEAAAKRPTEERLVPLLRHGSEHQFVSELVDQLTVELSLGRRGNREGDVPRWESLENIPLNSRSL